MAETSLGINVGFIGAGQMAEAMARGFSKAGVVPASQQFATDPSEARREVFQSFGVTALQSNAEVSITYFASSPAYDQSFCGFRRAARSSHQLL